MSTTTNTGGSAFPTSPIYNGDDEVVKAGGGMSLRDWFAGQALVGILAFPGAVSGNRDKSASTVVKAAYHYADAMLAERDK